MKKETFHAHELEYSILWKWQFCPNWITDSTQSLPNSRGLFGRKNWQTASKIYMGIQRT